MTTSVRKILKIILILFLISAGRCSFSQPGGTVRLDVVAGDNVPFVFNSIDKYNNGVTYTNWTVFTLTVVDIGNDDLPGSWTLDFQALTPNLVGDNGNLIPLPPAGGSPNPIQLTASFAGGGFGGGGDPSAWGVATAGTLNLRNDIPQTLVQDAVLLATEEPTTDCGGCYDQIAITYDCGVANPLLGWPIDYYTVDITFTFSVTF